MTILGGRIAAANGFATLPVFANYVNYGINPTPSSFGINDATFFGPPTGTEWGAQATYSASPSIRIAAGGFNTNLNSANGANHGADFALQEGNKGVLAIGEVDYLHNQSASSAGKPGQIALGGLFNNNSFPSLVSSSNRVNGYGGVYLMGQQMVFRPDGPGSFRGATLWGAWALSPRDTVSPVTTFWGAGFCYEGLIATRKHDVFSSGFILSDAGRYGPPNASEKFLELNYQWNHSQYLVITPHAQYLWKQENYDGRNATVIGVQIALIL
jgi:carbohydrate-selective porin OprB